MVSFDNRKRGNWELEREEVKWVLSFKIKQSECQSRSYFSLNNLEKVSSLSEEKAEVKARSALVLITQHLLSPRHWGFNGRKGTGGSMAEKTLFSIFKKSVI